MITNDPYGISHAVPIGRDLPSGEPRKRYILSAQDKKCLNCPFDEYSLSNCRKCPVRVIKRRGEGSIGHPRAIEDDELIDLVSQGMTDAEIAAMKHCRPDTISTRRRAMGLRVPPKNDPCVRCGSREICEKVDGKCPDKRAWERKNGISS